MKDLTAIIESLLFVYGEALPITKLSKLTDSSKDEVEKALEELKSNLENRGISLVVRDDKAQLVSNPDLSKYIEELIKDGFDDTLTSAALETLTIIAYLGPISRAQVDYIRGVNSSFIIRSLMMRGLVERTNDPKKSYIYLYKATGDLLNFLGVESIEDLPEYEKFSKILESKTDKETDENETQ